MPELGLWRPLALGDLAATMARARFRWWVSGGHALELHLGESWRPHDDLDLGIVRSDAPQALELLGGWELFVAAAGVLTPWTGRPLVADCSENNVWARRPGVDAWSIDITISDGTDDEWIFRRDTRIRLPWSEALLRSGSGLRYLAPEAQLLFKSREPRRPKDDHDASVVLPRLEGAHAEPLRAWLPATHPWQRLLPVP